MVFIPTVERSEPARLRNEVEKNIDFIPFGLYVAAKLEFEIPFGSIIQLKKNESDPFIEAIVFSVGNGLITKNGIILPRVNIGDSIVFLNKNFISRVDSEGNGYFVIKEEDIILVKNKENKNG